MPREHALMIRLNANDNVVVALQDLQPGTPVEQKRVKVREPIRAGHKVATATISAGTFVRKYGQIIGRASRDIQPGEHVHTHNLEMSDYAHEDAFGSEGKTAELRPAQESALFDGIFRDNGQVGTRNYIGVLPTVGCSSSVGRYIADCFRGDSLEDFPNVDGVVGLTQTSGCGLASSGEGFDTLQRTLAGYATHPNFWGVLLVGLGCEVMQIDALVENRNLEVSSRLQTLTIQEAGGTEAAVRRGVEMVKRMLPPANRLKRRRVGASHLMVGLECGGSDAYSGITANPALGVAADLVVRNGGTVVLSETTEIYGAEYLLARRAVSPEVGRRLLEVVQWWEEYTAKHGAKIDNNPTPGNKAGGLSTILEKSLGAVTKGGSTKLVEVYQYAERILEKGLVFMNTPGYDLMSTTGKIAGGANVICFTTGCGSVIGCKPTPVIKLASNTPMYERLLGDMDINCGIIAEGKSTVEEMGAVIFQKILETASGKKTKSEMLGYGDNEFAPWQCGVVV
jgi:altronate hydrolase